MFQGFILVCFISYTAEQIRQQAEAWAAAKNAQQSHTDAALARALTRQKVTMQQIKQLKRATKITLQQIKQLKQVKQQQLTPSRKQNDR